MKKWYNINPILQTKAGLYTYDISEDVRISVEVIK